MSSPKQSRSRQWWAATPRAARGTLLAGAAIVVALGITSAAVWASPGAGAPPASAEEKLSVALAENERLKSDLERARAAADTHSATPTPSVPATPTPTPTPTVTPTKKPDRGPSKQETIIVYRDRNSSNQGQAHPKPPKPSTPPPAVVKAPPRSTLLQPADRYFGMYTAQAPFSFATFDDAALSSGSRQSMVGYFGGWDQAFRPDAVQRAWSRGLLPMLTWESRPINSGNDVVDEPDYTLPRILGDPDKGVPGAFDGYLRTYAKAIVKTGLPLAIRLDHEMNGVWYPWSETTGTGTPINGNRPGDFVKMWRHVHDIFEAEGANKLVIWVWAPNIINNLPARNQSQEFLASLYPGDEYVDWVGLSGYLRTPFKTDQRFTFDYTFGRSLDQLRAIADKPILLAEVGATESGGHKAEWITSMFTALGEPANDDIVGFSWFNLAVTTISGGDRVTNDWRIGSRADTLAAFKAGLTMPAARIRLIPY